MAPSGSSATLNQRRFAQISRIRAYEVTRRLIRLLTEPRRAHRWSCRAVGLASSLGGIELHPVSSALNERSRLHGAELGSHGPCCRGPRCCGEYLASCFHIGWEDDIPESFYDVILLIGSSQESWERAAANAVEQASKSYRNLRVAEIVELDMQLDAKGKLEAYRAKVKLSFKHERSA